MLFQFTKVSYERSPFGLQGNLYSLSCFPCQPPWFLLENVNLAHTSSLCTGWMFLPLLTQWLFPSLHSGLSWNVCLSRRHFLTIPSLSPLFISGAIILLWPILKNFLCPPLDAKLCKRIDLPYGSSVQSLSHVRLFATPWIAAHQASLSITNSWSSPRLMSIESVMPSRHLILCRPFLLGVH